MAGVNKHGLSRDIPAAVRRKVRQTCGFGCVICGNAFYEYHHVNPPYVDAKIHDADKIVLLCHGCHGKIDAKLLSNETVMREAKHPKCLQNNFSHLSMDMGYQKLRVMMGSNSLANVRTLVKIGDETIFNMEPPEEPGGPVRLTASFHDDSGNEVASIIQNEWRGVSTNWDIEREGPKITIRKKGRGIVLVIRADPPDGIVIERLQMLYKGIEISVVDGVFWVLGPKNPDGRRRRFSFRELIANDIGILLNLPSLDDSAWILTSPPGKENTLNLHLEDFYYNGGKPWAFTGPPKAFKRRHKLSHTPQS